MIGSLEMQLDSITGIRRTSSFVCDEKGRDQRGVLLASVALVGLGGVLLMVFAPSRSDQASVAVPLKNV
jgi:hypothetical protein